MSIILTKKYSIGFHERGNCWTFKFEVTKFPYNTFYRFWCFFINKQK